MSFGKRTYLEYCASCHGEDGKGIGPAASALKTPPSDLTILAKMHTGNFPEHGSSDMPVGGPIFGARDKFDEVAVRQRIKNLCAYLASLQEKES